MFTFISNADNTIVEKYNIDNKIRLNESLLNSKFTNRFAKNIMFTFTSNVDNQLLADPRRKPGHEPHREPLARVEALSTNNSKAKKQGRTGCWNPMLLGHSYPREMQKIHRALGEGDPYSHRTRRQSFRILKNPPNKNKRLL